MIPRSLDRQQPPAWQQQLAQAVTDPHTLLQMLELQPSILLPVQLAVAGFGLRVPKGFIARMRTGDPADPLLRQVLPLSDELETTGNYSTDPLEERQATTVPGLLHKYQGRALLTLTGACAVHCRYCFRRHFPYANNNPLNSHWQQSLDYLGQHPDIREVIFSGGDPLSLTDQRLSALVADLEAIPSLQTLRIHSRTPVVLPERVDSDLTDWIGSSRLRVVLVIHANHSNELDTSVARAMEELRHHGVTLLNQSVLLRGVNDNSRTLSELSHRLFSMGVLPYYLHQLDYVQGAAHFEVDDATARKLIVELQQQLPGYLLPRLVREIPGEAAKTPL